LSPKQLDTLAADCRKEGDVFSLRPGVMEVHGTIENTFETLPSINYRSTGKNIAPITTYYYVTAEFFKKFTSVLIYGITKRPRASLC